MKVIDTPERVCPICDNNSVEVLYKINMAVQDQCSLPSSFNIVACESCGLIYQDSKADLEDYENYYKNFGKYYSSPTISEETKELFAHYIDVFNNFTSKESQILDMGCAGGKFLQLLREEGYKNLVGIDPSSECIEELKEKDIESYVGSIYSDELKFLNNRFDFIIISGVIEHLFDLKNALLNLDKYLKEDGIIFISVPDTERYCDYENSISYYFNLEHINHLSRYSLNNLMSKLNYKDIKTYFYDVKFGDSVVPVFLSMYKKYSCSERRFIKDEKSLQSVKKYLETHKNKSNSQMEAIDELVKSSEEIVIWGAGSVAMELLSRTNLRKCNIQAFVDKDSTKHGKNLLDKEICSIELLNEFSGTIIICAALYVSEILNEIKSMKLQNKILILK